MSRERPPRAPHWPDRSAHLRRRRARRLFWIAAAVVLVLPWFGYRHARDWLRPGAAQDPPVAEQPLSAPSPQGADAGADSDADADAGARRLVAGDDGADAAAAEEVEAIGRDARAGDGEAARERLATLGAQVHRDALLADRGSAVRRESARRELAALPGVRGAGWIDRMTVLLLVSPSGSGRATVARACAVLAGHGDVSGLAVRVQEVAAGAPAATAMLGECLPGAGVPGAGAGHGLPGTLLRPVEAVDGAGPEDPEARAERLRREEESLRILREHTPELQLGPDLGSPPDAD